MQPNSVLTSQLINDKNLYREEVGITGLINDFLKIIINKDGDEKLQFHRVMQKGNLFQPTEDLLKFKYKEMSFGKDRQDIINLTKKAIEVSLDPYFVACGDSETND